MRFFFLNLKKRPETKHNVTPCSSSGVTQVYGSPKIPNWFESTLFSPFFKAKIFTVAVSINATTVKILTSSLCRLGCLDDDWIVIFGWTVPPVSWLVVYIWMFIMDLWSDFKMKMFIFFKRISSPNSIAKNKLKSYKLACVYTYRGQMDSAVFPRRQRCLWLFMTLSGFPLKLNYSFPCVSTCVCMCVCCVHACVWERERRERDIHRHTKIYHI